MEYDSGRTTDAGIEEKCPMEWSYLVAIIIAIAWLIQTIILRGQLQELRTECVKNGYAGWLVEHSGKTTFHLRKISELRGMHVFKPEDDDA